MFDFDLPPNLIAQHPADKRESSRLLVLRRADAGISHYHFADLPTLLNPGDLLILNDTRVLPARLLGQREATGGKWEGLFLREHADGLWEMLCQTRGRLHEGEHIAVEPGPLRLRLEKKLGRGGWLVRPGEPGPASQILPKHGHIPLPPYIRKGHDDAGDRERYQTVFARQPGAVAAPTAGLHFSDEVFARLRQRGIDWSFVTLHVGWGTFQPLQTENFTQHHMHAEWGELPEATVRAIEACRERGGRVVAVGTTSVRVLETVAATGPLRPWSGETNLFIYPPYTFRVVDALVTNFHLPRTTLLLLVGAFTGMELLRQAYAIAVEEMYRFYSYGDAMLIL
jgi:S-adenosylmethionine:tRNA ribosyltransferase-isomerase